MPKVPSTSPATGNPIPPHYIHTTACHFVDSSGRSLLLRGVNLSGSSKAPVDRPSYILDDFWENAEAGGESFIGRPLNIDDGSADVHLARLRGWGFNMLRFPVTWEALEHQGPGKYDYEFMDYTIRVLRKCKDYGFKVYLDPHQDTWSRFSGGSGAPFWTLPACGIDPRNLTATQSAIVHSEYPLPHIPSPSSLPAMIWATNYGRLLSQTLFTLFFAGRHFAPHCILDGKNVQDWLQERYIEAFGVFADRIRNAGGLLDECVVGWDSLNEPFEGLCGWEDLGVAPVSQGSTLKKGTYPSPAQSFRLGMGQAQTVDNWSFGAFGPRRDGSVTIDPKGIKIWGEPEDWGEGEDGYCEKWGWRRDRNKWELGTCIWAQHGVWDVSTGFLLRPDYFHCSPSTGEPVDFMIDYWRPHFEAYTSRIRRAHPEMILFVQPPVFARPPPLDEKEVVKGRCVYSTHYYDGLTLVSRHWNWFNADALGLLRGKYTSTLQAVKIGTGAIRRSFQEQLGMLKSDAEILSGSGSGYPTIIGEIGTPFDMDGKRAYGWTDGGKYKGDYSRQEKALDASLNGGDGKNVLNWTIWNYCPDHTHDWGDGWNMEDLSIWSPDDLRESREGGDAIVAAAAMGMEMEAGMYDSRMADSRAVLIRKNNVNRNRCGVVDHVIPTVAAAASSLSLASLGSLHHSNRMFGPAGSSSDSVTILQTVAVQPNGIGAIGMHDGIKKAMLQPSADAIVMRSMREINEDPYGFLTDGARAVRAFCRPYPTKVVGVPIDIQFDINKAYFKLVVAVGPEDAAPSTTLGRSRRDLDSDDDDEEEEEDEKRGDETRATEVYLPLVHYAMESLLFPPGSLERQQQRTSLEESLLSSERSGSRSSGGYRRSGSVDDQRGVFGSAGSSVVGSRWASTADLPGAIGMSIASAPTTVVSAAEARNEGNGNDNKISGRSTASTSSSSGSSTEVNGSGGGPGPEMDIGEMQPSSRPSSPPSLLLPSHDLVDVAVKVSAGRWEVEGQTLRWWYDVPSKLGAGGREYTIEVRRRTGVIKPRVVAARRNGGGRRGSGTNERQRSLCERLCDEQGACRIM